MMTSTDERLETATSDVSLSSTDEVAEDSDSWTKILEFAQQYLGPKEKEAFRNLMKTASRIRILVVGATGVGKSTLLNGLLGKKIFDTGREELERVTTRVTEHKHHRNGVDIVIIDSPGLHDGHNKEKEYVKEMVEKIKAYDGIDLILYCKRMDCPAADIVEEKKIIDHLTNGIGELVDGNGKRIGKDIWKRCLFTLTFANVYEDSLNENSRSQNVKTQFNRRLKEWEGVFKKALNGCGIHVRIRVCPAGYKRQKLSDSDHWVSDFWAATFEAIIDESESGALSLLRLSHDRVVETLEETTPEETEPENHKIVLTNRIKSMVSKYAAGAGVAGTAGAVTGAAIGATIGAVGIGVLSFGPAAGAGLVLGGAIGAVVGSVIGGGILKVYHSHKAKKEKREAEAANRT